MSIAGTLTSYTNSGPTKLVPRERRKLSRLAGPNSGPIAFRPSCPDFRPIDVSAEANDNNHDNCDERQRGDLQVGISVGSHYRVVH